jgi:hypothetical protein
MEIFMNNPNERFFAIYTELLSGNAALALDSFRSAYRETPDHPEFLHGIIISLIMLSRISEIRELLKKEKDIAKQAGAVSAMHKLFAKNVFASLAPSDILFNAGVYVARSVSRPNAKLYFDVALSLDPGNRKLITAMAEYNILDGEYEDGLKLYARAAKGY